MIIVGLGNPGQRYAETRHNAGFLVLEAICLRWHVGSWGKFDLYDEAPLRYAGQQHRLVRPTTCMNLSGDAVVRLLRAAANPADLFVVLDDVDLPLGRIRIRPDGGAGGHHGLQSVLDALFPATVARMRIGVGRPTPDEGAMVDHVLGRFSDEEQARFEQMLDRALQALEVILRDGIQPAMNRFNGLPAPWVNLVPGKGRGGRDEASAEARREGR